MDALSLLQPLSPLNGSLFGTPAGGSFPLAASARLAGSDGVAGNPWVDNAQVQGVMRAANEAATQGLLAQVVQLLAGLIQNQAGAGSAAGGPGQVNGSGGGGCCSSKGSSQGGSSGGGSSAGGASGASGGGQASSSGGSSSNFASEKAAGKQVDRQGKKIDASIADNFDAMVAAAKKDGVDLQISSGFRSRQEQEVLYQKYLNGTGNLAAKPGTSNHESGLAIDFRDTPGAFAWLKKNSTRFGLKNLPSEPWHYSVDGR